MIYKGDFREGNDKDFLGAKMSLFGGGMLSLSLFPNLYVVVPIIDPPLPILCPLCNIHVL